MLLIALVIILPLAQGTGLKTYCLSGKDPDCDEDWQPFANMASALVGYDLPRGNAFATTAIEDPGLRKQIFNVTFEDADGDYVMEAGITMREYSMCDAEFRSSGAVNMKGYGKLCGASSLTGSGFDVGLEAEADGGRQEGTLPPMVHAAWQQTPEYERVRQFVFRTRGAVVVSEAKCVTHKIDISHFLTPGFHPAFLEVLRFLEQQDTEVRQTRAFKRFIRDYGTHYVSSALMGSKVATTVFYSNYERLKYGRQRLFNCSADFARRSFGMADDAKPAGPDLSNPLKAISTPKSDEDDEDEDNDVVQGEMKQCPDLDSLDPDRVLTTTFGVRPETDLKSWGDQDKFRPIPVKFELTPIVNLMTEENLDERHNISSVAILKWFLPLYLKYCKIFEMDCDAEIGCGFNDDCGFEENCVTDRLAKNGWKCQAPSWADVPNWPQMPEPPSNQLSRKSSQPHDEPDSPNISWFFEKDVDQSGGLSAQELWVKYAENNWYNTRYQTAMKTLMQEADLNRDASVDMAEYIKLHETQPWFAEQISFMLMNTDSNDHLSKQELLEASRISPDMHQLNFGEKQLENLVDGLFKIGDKNGDGKITFAEYVHMARDVFVDNFAPNVFKRVMKR